MERLSATEFLCEGNSLRCSNPECRFIYSLRGKNRKYAERDPCPRCAKKQLRNALGRAFKLERSKHKVDLTPYEANGACACEYFQMTLEPLLRKMRKPERLSNRQRCVHIHIVREHALDEVIMQHVKEHEA